MYSDRVEGNAIQSPCGQDALLRLRILPTQLGSPVSRTMSILKQPFLSPLKLTVGVCRFEKSNSCAADVSGSLAAPVTGSALKCGDEGNMVVSLNKGTPI